MSESDRYRIELARWDTAQARAGQQNARRLAQLAHQRPVPAGPGTEALNIGCVGICGAGIMGAGIAAENVRHQIPVRIYDAAPAAVQRTVDSLRNEFGDAVARHADSNASDLQRVIACQQLDELADCDLVIESVVENRELKQQIHARLAQLLGGRAILSSNTSTILVDRLAAALPDPTRFCGLHFCNPVPRRRLVEIIRGSSTSERTVATATAYATRIGKLPIVVKDSPGFVVNRLLLPYLNEALEMVCQGADLQAIDRAARGFGMAMGPFELFDLIGIDTAMWAGRTLWEAFPDRISLTPVLPALAKRDRLGLKSKLGFYRYESPDGNPTLDADLIPILAPYIRHVREFTPQDITLRLILPMLVEATRALEEEIVQDARDVDVGVLYGLAFPESRGGLLHWADSLGAASIVELLKPLESLGTRMQPTTLLLDMAESGQPFYK